jgi:hypothetical protein
LKTKEVENDLAIPVAAISKNLLKQFPYLSRMLIHNVPTKIPTNVGLEKIRLVPLPARDSLDRGSCRASIKPPSEDIAIDRETLGRFGSQRPIGRFS